MKKADWKQMIGMAAFCAVLTVAAPMKSQAAVAGPGLENGNFVAMVEETLPIYVSMDSYDVIRDAQPGECYKVTGVETSEWIEVELGDTVGYIALSSVILEDMDELQAEEREEMEAQVEAFSQTAPVGNARRQHLVEFALQFVGFPYRYGGSDPHSGVDCSGFVRYVMQHGAGVSLSRSSGAQAGDGVAVSADQMRPGDLIFYGNGSRINHVAMYIGNGQVVHASTYKTGVKTSAWNYRTPVKIVNVLGD